MHINWHGRGMKSISTCKLNEPIQSILTTTLTCLDRSLELLCRKSEKAAYTMREKRILGYTWLPPNPCFNMIRQFPKIPHYEKTYNKFSFGWTQGKIGSICGDLCFQTTSYNKIWDYRRRLKKWVVLRVVGNPILRSPLCTPPHIWTSTQCYPLSCRLLSHSVSPVFTSTHSQECPWRVKK